MRRGFSLVELLVALLVLQVGLLATAGMILTAQRGMVRSELILRGVVEARRVADSLGAEESPGAGRHLLPWGEVVWEASSQGPGGLRVLAISARGDTLATVTAWLVPVDTLPWVPRSPSEVGGGPI